MPHRSGQLAIHIDDGGVAQWSVEPGAHAGQVELRSLDGRPHAEIENSRAGGRTVLRNIDGASIRNSAGVVFAGLVVGPGMQRLHRVADACLVECDCQS